MSFLPIPDYSFRLLEQVSPEFLKSAGITLLLLDLDNTISPYGAYTPTRSILDWTAKMKKAGITLFIVSNNHGDRPVKFAESLDIGYIKAAGKPSGKGVREAIKLCGGKAETTALAGDQIYTDIIAAKRAGVKSILIAPISLKNPLLAIRYVFEVPFRVMTKEKVK